MRRRQSRINNIPFTYFTATRNVHISKSPEKKQAFFQRLLQKKKVFATFYTIFLKNILSTFLTNAYYAVSVTHKIGDQLDSILEGLPATNVPNGIENVCRGHLHAQLTIQAQ